MKILCVTSATLNAYNSNINNTIKREYPQCTIRLGIEDFWNMSGDYDIIHLQWPEALFNWKKNVAKKDLDELMVCLHYWKSKSRLIVTRHNASPYLHNNKFYEEIFEEIFRSVSAIIHLENYSVTEFQKRYPSIQVNHVVIPIGAYTNYPNNMSKAEARKKLNISNKKFVLAVFGSIRTEEEKKLVLDSFNKVKIKNKSLLITRWPYYPERSRRWKEYFRFYFSKKYYIRSQEIADSDIQIFMNAADIVFIPRHKALNSSMLTLGFTFGKTVVGPNLGSIGDVLHRTGNPIYDPNNINSASEAIMEGKLLTEKGKGDENRHYALQHWNLELTAKKHVELYTQVLATFKS